jgi:hypothetical protein
MMFIIDKYGKFYKMKKHFKANNLVIGNLSYISSELNDCGPVVKTTSQKYIFEVIKYMNKPLYREVFTGFIAKDECESIFDLPYVVNVEKFIKFLPNTENVKVPRLSLMMALNDINYVEVEEVKVKKK